MNGITIIKKFDARGNFGPLFYIFVNNSETRTPIGTKFCQIVEAPNVYRPTEEELSGDVNGRQILEGVNIPSKTKYLPDGLE
jgi:hypothetical protein